MHLPEPVDSVASASALLRRPGRLALLASALLAAACASGPSRDEIEAAKKTIDCDRNGERILVRFEEDEARVLLPDGTRVILYQVTTPSGLRYLGSEMELRGNGVDLQLIRHGEVAKLKCKPYELPKKDG